MGFFEFFSRHPGPMPRSHPSCYATEHSFRVILWFTKMKIEALVQNWRTIGVQQVQLCLFEICTIKVFKFSWFSFLRNQTCSIFVTELHNWVFQNWRSSKIWCFRLLLHSVRELLRFEKITSYLHGLQTVFFLKC